MAQAEMLVEDDKISVWLNEDTKADLENQFLRYGIQFNEDNIYTKVLNNDNPKKPKWFDEAKVNLGYECLDKQAINEKQNKLIAFVYLENGTPRTITYEQLLFKVKKFTRCLVRKLEYVIDRVLIILPTCLEAVISILACLRLGILFSIMEPNYTQCMQLRMEDFKPTILITTNGCEFNPFFLRGVNEAIEGMSSKPPRVRYIIKRQQYEAQVLQYNQITDIDFNYEYKDKLNAVFQQYSINKELYVAYTAGTSGKPKGCIHSAMSLYMSCISDNAFTVYPQRAENPVSFFLTDLSDIVGFIGIVLKPLLFTVKSVLYEAVKDNADPTQIYKILKEFQVTSAYFLNTTLEQLKSKDANGAIAKSFYDQDFKLKTVFTSGPKPELLNWMAILFSKQFPLQMYNFHAITELGGIICTDHSGTLGQPLTRCTVGRFVPFLCATTKQSSRGSRSYEMFLKLPLPPIMMISYYDVDNKKEFSKNFYDLKGYYAIGHTFAFRNYYEFCFDEDELIPKLERDMVNTKWVSICCVLCKEIGSLKRLYGFFQMNRAYSSNSAAAICKEIQASIRYMHGSSIHFEAFNIAPMPLLPGKRRTPHRELMNKILHNTGFENAEQYKNCFGIDSFVAKVKKINGC